MGWSPSSQEDAQRDGQCQDGAEKDGFGAEILHEGSVAPEGGNSQGHEEGGPTGASEGADRRPG